jgi:hypothetical protein
MCLAPRAACKAFSSETRSHRPAATSPAGRLGTPHSVRGGARRAHAVQALQAPQLLRGGRHARAPGARQRIQRHGAPRGEVLRRAEQLRARLAVVQVRRRGAEHVALLPGRGARRASAAPLVRGVRRAWASGRWRVSRLHFRSIFLVISRSWTLLHADPAARARRAAKL